MKKGVKVISIALLITMIFLTACSGNASKSQATPDSSKATDANSGGGSGGSGGGSSNSLYTIKVFADANVTKVVKNFSDTPVGKIVKDKFNIDFEFVPAPTGTNSQQNLNLMLAGGNYPEIVDTQCECQDTFKKYVQAGAVIKLDPYLKDMPNFTKLYKDPIKYWRYASGDGSLYNWNAAIPQDIKSTYNANDLLVRTDILKEAGYPKLVSADDYVDFLTKALKAHPTTNGQKTLGMVVPFGESWGMAGLAPILYEKGNYIQVANGAVIWDPIKEHFVDMFTDPYTKESFQFFNKLYRAGVLDKESFTDKLPQVQEKLNSGRALSGWYTVWLQHSVDTTLMGAGHPEDEYVEMPIQTKTQIAKGEKRTINIQLTNPFDTVMITKNAKDPKRILQLLDWASSDEGQLLLQSGIKGTHYNIVDGKRVPTDAYLKGVSSDPDYKAKQGIGIVPFLGSPNIASPSDGQPYNMDLFPSIKDSLLTPSEKETYKGLGWASSYDWWLKNGEGTPIGLGGGITVDPTSEYGTLEQKLTDFRVKNTPKLFMAASDAEFEQVYNDLVKQYNAMDPQKVVDKYNELYKSGMEKINQYSN